ncbi:AbgT family transporter [Myxococcus llanfairpwllgwyngyllgogerychwyrndrobwllllantysiliogogogochensis]|uniref:AbgT family transporter n=1 Tax=Myxococcus llanfairpwllgwyngyllgogerychwyrndrobwllllantysiliogogogochensis TaxID=2590453 RepID=A0A540X939_9BACT|nr:AbgT family transporter [Myxococcus llanfairpwllgwyngyllgogerychwyrndrobwllllantysiliogogogochensis]TQF17750.1 AbgT family transporter [Myxococcus llanfairpwllgwyngyllgogerychwyrndrobwllllantysiliogogogochensis]
MKAAHFNDSMPERQTETPPKKKGLERILDTVERVGNKVPHPAVIFVALIGIVILLSHVFYMMGASVTYQTINPETHVPEETTAAAKSLLTGDGLRFMFEGVVQNFMNFNAVGVIIVAMLGVGVADAAGLVGALIRKLVAVAPRKALTYILVFVGILSSIAADAGYLVLIPLAAAAFLTVGRHPLAGLAASFAGVAAVFTVNILIKPLDGILTEITNDAIHILNPERSIDLTANFWFSVASVIMLTFIVSLITDKVISPRLGEYKGEKPDAAGATMSADESRGLKFAGLGVLAVLVFFGLLTLPPGAPLRNPETGAIVGDSPFMNGLIVAITLLFLVAGAAYGIGAKTIRSSVDVIKAMEKAVSGLGALIFLLFIISQFIALFTYTNMATLAAVKMGDILEDAGLGALPLLVGFVGVVAVLDLIMTGAIPKWAIFAPVFVPLLMRLNVDPEAVLAAYRVGDGPFNAISPLNAYFALIVTFAQKYQKEAGVGTIVALMLPYVVVVFIAWILLLVAWQVLGLPWGLG